MLNTDNVTWTGGGQSASAGAGRRRVWIAALGGALVVLVAALSVLWLAAAPQPMQQGAWYLLQARVVHADAGDRLLTAIELHDPALFASAVSKTCGIKQNENCLTWVYDKAIFHRHWGHFSYRSKDGDPVSVWNVNRLALTIAGQEEIVQAWGFVLDPQGLVKDIL